MSDFAIQVKGVGKRYRIRSATGLTQTFTSNVGHLFSKFNPKEREAGNDFVWALKDVSFEVKEGEVIGIIGKNGSGKSTLLKILSGITRPTVGEIELYGRVGSLLEVGTGFHPELTGRENVFLNGAILGLTIGEIRRKFDEIVAFAEIEKFIDTPVKHYSSGMYVRLAFAVAAHLEPEILLVDEVLAVGDLAFQQKCMGKVGNLVKAGRTVLFVSHSIPAIRNLCSRAVLLEQGQVEEFGETNLVISRYLPKFAIDLNPVVALPSASADQPGVAKFLKFMSVGQVPQAQFTLGEPWRIVLEFELFRSVSHTIAAVGLLTLDGTPIVTYWSKPSDLGPGEYIVQFVCDLPLSAGDLRFVVGLSSYERSFYYEQGVGRVSIAAVAKDGQPLRASGSGLMFSLQHNEIMLLRESASART